MSVTRFLAGFAIGAAIGAVAGILLAPKSGEETREMLASSAKEAAAKAAIVFISSMGLVSVNSHRSSPVIGLLSVIVQTSPNRLY